MYVFHLSSILCFVTFLNAHLTILNAHLLPEDSVTDNEEQLNREKRDNLFDSILKTIPFFNPTVEQDLPTDPNDDDDIIIITPIDEPIMSTSALNTASITSKSTVLPPLSKSIFPSATIFSMNNTSSVSQYHTTNFTSTILSNSTQTSYLLLPTFSISMTTNLVATPTLLPNISTSVMKTKAFQSTLPASLTYPSSKNLAQLSQSSTEIQPTSSLRTVPTSSAIQAQDTIINMMIMPGEQTILPNEKGYGDTIAGEPIVDKDMKSIRFIYRNVLVPVMSGILGALLITFAFIVYKCVRRRKLQKVRYYGGKPNTSLYRLDHMSLLSDDSSDED